MKYLIILVALCSLSSFAQTNIKNIPKCKHCKGKISEKYFKKYFSNLRTIKENCSEYFGDTLDNVLKPKFTNVKTISLKFDALGAVYPIELSPGEERKYFEKKKYFHSIKSNKYLYRNTYYELFKKQYYQKGKIKIMESEDRWTPPPPNSVPFENQIEFTAKWNDEYLNSQIENLKRCIENDIENVFFIVHGYNVPYSLAQIQANSIIDRVYALDSSKASKTLFVKVFWPSTNRKKIVEENGSFFIKNKINLYSISGFRSIATRAYLVGNSMRTVINGIANFKGNIFFMSHSLGAQVTTSTFIIPCLEKNKNSALQNYLDMNPLIGNKFKSINILLNAPAMPGVVSFPEERFINTDNIKWTIGYNSSDKVLRKTIGIFRFGDHNGNTRLGGNWENETWKLKDHLKKNKKIGQFDFVQTGVQSDLFGHDFFCYLLQPSFQESFSKFLK